LEAAQTSRNRPAQKENGSSLTWLLRPGYSDGPLVDHQGTLIGMSISMTGQEVGMAVPSHVIEEFVAKASSADWSGSGTILV